MNIQNPLRSRERRPAIHPILTLLLFLATAPASRAADGDVDTSFNPPRPNGMVAKIRVLPGGRMLIAGTFTALGSTQRHYIARLMSNGDIDPSFDPGVGPNQAVTGFDLQPDGHILISGPFTSVSGQPRNGYARLTDTGALDPDYAKVQPFIALPQASRGSRIYSLTGGRALLTGSTYIFTISPFVQRAGAIVLNADGNCDATFNMTIPNVIGASPVAGEKVLVHGAFTTAGAVVRNGLARVDIVGNLDPSFEAPVAAANNAVVPAIVLPDGRILYAQAEPTGTRLHRVTADGPVDGSFVNPVLTGALMDCAVQGDGKLIISGDFDSTDDRVNTSPRLARLNANGSFDTSFRIGDGGSSTVFAVAIQEDGRVLVGGAFQSWNNTAYAGIVRLMAGSAPPPPPAPRLSSPAYAAGTFSVAVPTEPGSQYTLELLPSLSAGNWSPVSPAVPGDGSIKTLSHPNATAPGAYYRVSVQ
ncbi:MAG: delta-60 repeat domain-containing protein [Verrucomicrobiales bacterium]|nr:delta-60 repeat domain-containing protein [Verrucomicrobiales bacterium]